MDSCNLPLAYLQKSPARIFFYCEKAPPAGAGGETPIVPGHVVYRRVCEDQKLAGELLGRGPVYLTGVLSEKHWSEKFKTNDKEVAESRAEKAVQRFVEWLGGHNMKVSTKALPEFFRPDRAGRMSLFGGVGHLVVQNRERDEGKVSIEFGDGKQVSDESMEAVFRILREEEVVFQWEEGDLLLLDNSAVLHSRQPHQIHSHRLHVLNMYVILC